MKSFRALSAILALAIIAGCHDSSVAPVKPAAITILTGNAQSATVAQPLLVAPTFVVSDASGNPLAGVHVSVAVTSGGGSITDAPTKSSAPQTSVGKWTLGTGTGVQSLTVTVDGLAPIVFTATANAAAPAHLAALTPGTITAHAGDVASTLPSVRVTDQFNNPVPGAVVNVAIIGGGAAPTTATSDAQGVATLASWSFGTVAGQSALTLSTGAANSVSFLATVLAGDPTTIAIDNAPTTAFAGATLSAIGVRVTDKYNNTITGQSASFTLTAGGGTLASPLASSRADGSIALPAWTLGRSAVRQSVHVTAGALAADINVPVTSSYNIDVRFFGPAMTDQQKAWFTNAAARISGAIVGDVPDVPVSNLDVSAVCGVDGLPTITETIDDLVIYAAVAPIDGAGKILAESGPCVFRNPQTGGFSVIGVMLFDSADMATMAQQGITQDVITHEMLHSVGVGTMWEDKRVISGEGTLNSTFTGIAGTQGCVNDGGAATCTVGVPVENNGVPGTADAHWRESTFGNELMTGYVNLGGMPFSAITVGSLGDLGYQVNLLAADPYRLPGTGAATTNRIPGRAANEAWEKVPPSAAVLGAGKFDPPTFIRKP